MSPRTGRMLKEDGTTINWADIIGGTDTGLTAKVNLMQPMSGRMVKEDGTIVNVADVIEEFLNSLAGGGSGGTVSLKKLTITVDGQEYNYDGKTAVTIPITTGTARDNKPLKIVIGENIYTYDGTESMEIIIPAIADPQPLKITIDGNEYSYDGKEAVSLEITNPEPVTNKALNISIGGQSYSYDGSAEVDISIPAAEGVEF